MSFLHIKRKKKLSMLKRAKVLISIDVYKKNTTKKHYKLRQKVSRLTSAKYLETYILKFNIYETIKNF